MVYVTPHPDDDAQLTAWRRRQAEDTVRTLAIRLPLDLARRLRAEAAARGVPGRPGRRRPPPRRAGRPPRRSAVRRRPTGGDQCARHADAAGARRSGSG